MWLFSKHDFYRTSFSGCNNSVKQLLLRHQFEEYSTTKKCIFLGVMRKSEVILESAEEITLWCGDHVMAIAFNPALAPALKILLKKTHPVSWSLFRSRLNWEHQPF